MGHAALQEISSEMLYFVIVSFAAIAFITAAVVLPAAAPANQMVELSTIVKFPPNSCVSRNAPTATPIPATPITFAAMVVSAVPDAVAAYTPAAIAIAPRATFATARSLPLPACAVPLGVSIGVGVGVGVGVSVGVGVAPGVCSADGVVFGNGIGVALRNTFSVGSGVLTGVTHDLVDSFQ